MQKIKKGNLKIDSKLVEFIEKEVIPGTDIDPNKFWSKFDDIVHNLSTINKKLLKQRLEIQKKIDAWHVSKKDTDFNNDEYLAFLKSINYLVDEKEDFKISTSNVDEEIKGPAIIESAFTTVVIDPGAIVTRRESGSLSINPGAV